MTDCRASRGVRQRLENRKAILFEPAFILCKGCKLPIIHKVGKIFWQPLDMSTNARVHDDDDTMQAAMASCTRFESKAKSESLGNAGISSENENRALLDEKFDSEPLSLHVLSIP